MGDKDASSGDARKSMDAPETEAAGMIPSSDEQQQQQQQIEIEGEEESGQKKAGSIEIHLVGLDTLQTKILRDSVPLMTISG